MSVGRCNTLRRGSGMLHLSRARDAGGATVGDQRCYRHHGWWGQCPMHVMWIHERVRDVLDGGISHSHVARASRS